LKIGFILKMAVLYVWRSRRSTLVLGLMIIMAVAALVFLSSLAVGTNDAMIRNSVGLFSGHIVADNLPPDLDPAQLQRPGVREVLWRTRRPVRLRHQERVESVLLCEVRPSEEKAATALWKKTVSGRYLRDGRPELFLSGAVADLLHVSVGQTVEVEIPPGPQRVALSICGIYRTGISSLDYGIAFAAQNALPAAESNFSAAVFIEEGTDPQTLLAEYRRLPYASRFTAWMDFMPDLKQLVELNFVSMSIVMVLVFAVVALGISCAFIIFILKNIREHGILKAMGMLPSESVLLIVAEVTLLTLAASATGTGAGALAVGALARTGLDLTALTSHNQYFAVSGVIFPRLTPYSLWLPPALSLLFGLLAAVWPALYVVREKAAEILRSI